MYIDKADAIGKSVRMSGREGEIIGIVKDFHFSSLHTNIGPLVIFPEDQFNKIFVKLPKGDLTATLASIESTFRSIVPDRPFEFQFVDQQYQALYTNEQRMGIAFTVFAFLAIVIACLGLLGLVAFSAAQKTKEIGIRKVMGATAPHIVMLITRDYTRLVILAIGIGLPTAYFAMSEWLKNFAYQTSIGASPFIIATLICIFIALGAASYQAIKAALIDPAKTLRNE